MTIEQATLRDLDALLKVDVLLTSRPRQDAILRDSVSSGGCLVARAGARFAGFITWDLGFFGRPFVRLLVVLPALRRSGAGRALLQSAERAATPHGELFVSTESLNTLMQALLRSLDYAPSGAIENINPPGNPELIFHKRLRP